MQERTRNKWVTIVLAVILSSTSLSAQEDYARPSGADVSGPSVTSDSVPDAPLPFDLREKDAANQANNKPFAPKFANTIEPAYQTVHLDYAGKVCLAGSELFSFEFPINVVLAAGLSHGLDTNPKYGSNSEAFAKRVGAAGARNASQIILSHALLAPLLRQDTRYYVMGSGHSILKRAAYAATRVVISRTDSGRSTINFAELAGYGGTAALTQLYYPEQHRDRNIVLSTYGSSLLGLAIHNEAWEFLRFLNRSQPR